MRWGRLLGAVGGGDLLGTVPRGGGGVATSVGQRAVTFPAWALADLGVAAATAASPRWQRLALAATATSRAARVAAGALRWRWRLPSRWGPEPTAALPLAAAAASAVALQRFLAAERSTRRAA